jgi:hypothetical protein
MDDILRLSTVITNIGIIIIGFKIVRHITRMEFKVDMMWNAFEKKFNTER